MRDYASGFIYPAPAPVRIQITVGDTLVAEAVVEPAMADRLWSRYACAKYRKGLPVGGAIMQRADLPRTFDVSVGERIADAVLAGRREFKVGR